MELLVLLIIVYACRQAVTDTKHAAGKSRKAYMKSADSRFPGMPRGKRAAHAARHDLGFGLGQVRHGFPQARHGFTQGWHESRQAHVQAMAGAQKAKTEHLETRAGLAPQLREYRARQQAALEQIRGGQPVTGDDGQAKAAGSGESPVEAHDVDGCPDCGGDHSPYQACPARKAGGKAEGSGGEGSPEPAEGGEPVSADGTARPGQLPPLNSGAERRAGQAGRDIYDPPADGQPVTPASTDTAVVTENGEPVTGKGGEEGSPGASPSASTEGDNTMADGNNTQSGSGEVTYDGVQREMSAAAAAAENQAAAAEAAAKAAANTAEQMQALEMDPATLGAMADHLDAHEAMKAAAARVQETAETTQTTLARGHSGLSAAHKEAPVDAAAKPFYQEG
jgi:hypothetical protein